MKRTFEPFDIYVDDVLSFEDVPTCYIQNTTGKLGANDMLIEPLSVVNDGVNEITVITSKISAGQMIMYLDQMVKHGGIQGYDKNICHLRGRTSKVVAK